MKREVYLEILRMLPIEDGELEPQYCWRFYDRPTAQDLIDEKEVS